MEAISPFCTTTPMAPSHTQPLVSIGPAKALPAPDRRPAPVLLTGGQGVASAAHRVMVAAVQAGQSPLVVSTGMDFDPYRLAALARERGMDAQAVLSAVRVMRVMSVDQLLEALRQLYARPSPGGVLLMRPQRLFGDPDLNEADAQFFHQRFLRAIRFYERAGLPLMVVERTPCRQRPPLFERMRRAIPQQIPIDQLPISGYVPWEKR